MSCAVCIADERGEMMLGCTMKMRSKRRHKLLLSYLQQCLRDDVPLWDNRGDCLPTLLLRVVIDLDDARGEIMRAKR
jgi:hypothetical protein